jgi:hypothetical protein
VHSDFRDVVFGAGDGVFEASWIKIDGFAGKNGM